MKSIKQLEFDEYTDLMVKIIEKKIKKHKDDQLYLVCGYEGKGKSTLSIAIQCETYRKLGMKPTYKHILFNWEEYLAANIQVMLQMTKKKEYAQEELGRWQQYYSLDFDDDTFKSAMEIDYEVDNGSIIVYDEAATQTYSREAMKNIDQTKLLILNRFIRLMHLYNVPKPQSLDIYPREQRPRGMLWCVAEYTEDMEQRIRGAYFYTQDTYQDIFNQRYWWRLFSNDNALINAVTPDFEIILPSGKNGLLEYIPKEIQQNYDAKKLMSGISQSKSMWEKVKKMDKKKEGSNNNGGKWVKPGETKKEWCDRTGLSPGSYRRWTSHTQRS